MTAELHSQRMTFQPPSHADTAEIFEFLGDPIATQFTEMSPDFDACRSKILAHEAQRPKVGFAPWSIRMIDSSQIIGWGGLYLDPFDEAWGLEVGYFFAPAAWGQGLATELVWYCCDLLTRQNWQGDLLGFSHRQNLASAKVLKKAGFAVKSFHKGLNRLVWSKPFHLNC